jgi:hypothetical protein
VAITQTLCTSFKAELMLAVHDFRVTSGDTFKIALYSSSASLDASTTAYSATNEVTGTNYSAGGVTLVNLGVSISSTTGVASFDDVTITGTNITASGALIYNTTPSANGTANTALTNPAVCVLDFGAPKAASGGSFTITFPTADSTSAVIRIA